ncbi:hypothetical protein FB451DRAFT_1390242 [Mycena latifolia]|nr:hypothetical protein FB451DRAFT_1390242 [Mycena latifolia]
MSQFFQGIKGLDLEFRGSQDSIVDDLRKLDCLKRSLPFVPATDFRFALQSASGHPATAAELATALLEGPLPDICRRMLAPKCSGRITAVDSSGCSAAHFDTVKPNSRASDPMVQFFAVATHNYGLVSCQLRASSDGAGIPALNPHRFTSIFDDPCESDHETGLKRWNVLLSSVYFPALEVYVGAIENGTDLPVLLKFTERHKTLRRLKLYTDYDLRPNFFDELLLPAPSETDLSHLTWLDAAPEVITYILGTITVKLRLQELIIILCGDDKHDGKLVVAAFTEIQKHINFLDQIEYCRSPLYKAKSTP